MAWHNASLTVALVMSLAALPAAAADGSDRLDDELPALPVEVLHQQDVDGSSGELLLLSNGDLLAVSLFTGFVRFDQTGRVVWRQNRADGEPRDTVALPDGGFVTVGRKKALPVSVFPPGIAVKGNTDLWVGRFDDRGNPLWTRTFGGIEFEMGQSVAALQNGTLVVAGINRDRTTWLLNLTPGGRLWGESHVGGSRSAVVALTDSEFGVVAQVPEYRRDCRDAFDITPVKLWRFDTRVALRLRDIVTVRNDASGDRSGCGWHFEIARGRDVAHAFVLSAWTSTHKSPPASHITKVDLADGQVWTKEVPRVGARACRLSMTLLPDGDPVVICGRRQGVELHRLDASDGRRTSYRVDPPSCDAEVEPAGWLLIAVGGQALPNGSLALAGSTARRVGEGTGPDAFRRCGWLVKVALPAKEPR